MNTSQLECCIDCSSMLKKSTLGVFAADQLPLPSTFPSGFIANTDNRLKEGRHWCSFYFQNSNTVEYFDSYGKPLNYFNSYFPKYASQFSTLVVNNKQLQSVNSDVCGMYCLYFLLQRMNGVSFYNVVHSFSDYYECNDSFVYNYISSMFPYCTRNFCFNNQICKTLINMVSMYLIFFSICSLL